MLYACGSNGGGQLGLGHYEDVDQWTVVDFPIEGPIEVIAGGNHTVILEHVSGRAFITHNAVFCEITHPLSKKWTLASAGWAFTILVDEANRIWSLGDGPNGELGLGSKIMNTSSLSMVDWYPSSPITCIKSGMRHTVLLTEFGKLYGWGASRKQQCGTIDRIVYEPKEFPVNPTPAVQVACGRDFTVVMRQDGVLELWGDQHKFFEDGKAPVVQPIAKLLAGWSCFAIGHQIYGNTKQNGLDPLAFEGQLTAMGSEHALCIHGNTVSTYGWGEHGNCPPVASFEGQLQVFGGCATSFIRTIP